MEKYSRLLIEMKNGGGGGGNAKECDMQHIEQKKNGYCFCALHYIMDNYM